MNAQTTTLELGFCNLDDLAAKPDETFNRRELPLAVPLRFELAEALVDSLTGVPGRME